MDGLVRWLRRVLGGDEPERWVLVYETEHSIIMLGDVIATRDRALHLAAASSARLWGDGSVHGRIDAIAYGSHRAKLLRASRHGQIGKVGPS